jgi:hypothetical protein
MDKTEKNLVGGFYPHLKRHRTVQDPEAAKNVPVDLARGFISGAAGAPGDIESIIRLLINIQGPENFVMPKSKDEALAMLGQVFGANRVSLDTSLPTSEDIEKRLPFKSDAPVSQAFTGMGQLAGNFYTGPGAPIRLVTGVPKAFVKAGKDFAMAAGQPATRMFIGPKAKTWNQAKADEAARMEKAGADPVDIWRQTGTFRGADGIPRQEISDQGARFLSDVDRQESAQAIKSGIDVLKEKIRPTKQKDLFPRSLTEAKKGVRERIDRAKMELEEYKAKPSEGVRAETIIDHPELYKAYPELADMQVVAGGYGGEGTKAALSIIASSPSSKGLMEIDIFDKALKADPRSSSLHEMQHAVQTIEGMSPGGSTAMAFNDPRTFEILKRIREDYSKPMSLEDYKTQRYGTAMANPERLAQAYKEYLDSIKPKNVGPELDRLFQEEAAREYYKRLAGEAEARATQARRDMTPQERTQEYPYASYDVPPEDLLTKPPREYAGGGAVGMAGGGALAKAVKAAQAVGRQAPAVVIPSAVSRVQEAVRQSKGDFGARRVQRAADEIPNLERMYQEDGLRFAFTGDNAQALMTMNPADFEKFALPLVKSKGARSPMSDRGGEIDKYTLPTDEYIQYLQKLRGGFEEPAFLSLNKEEAGLPLLPFISGHEGRHRSRALAASGQPTSLVRLIPRAELREPFPRRSQEEYLDALRQELDLTGNLVLPEGGGSPVVLPDIYAEGGQVTQKYAGGGALAKAIGQAARKAPKAGAEEAIVKAAESAGMKAPVVAQKELTTLQDSYTSLGDRVKMEAELARRQMEGFDYKYDKGQRVFTKSGAEKNLPPYEIVRRTRVGNQPMREDSPKHGPGMGRPVIDPETGKTMRTPYEPGYRVRRETGPDEWYETDIPQSVIVGDVDMARGGPVHISNNPDTMRLELNERRMGAGGFLSKAVKGAQKVLPAAEREANFDKFLEPSKIKDKMYHGTTVDISQFRPSSIGNLGPGTYASRSPRVASEYAMVTNRKKVDQPQPNVLPVYVQAKNPFIIESANKSNEQFFKYFDPTGKLSDQEVIRRAIDAGHDAVYAKDTGELNIFNPSQIKSATGNRGTYDVTDPDINKAGGGAILAKAVKNAQKNVTAPAAPRTLSAGDIVNGMLVRKDIPNTSSIGASLTDYSTHGLQEVPMSAFDTVGKPKYRNAQEEKRTKELARQIQENKELNPLIVVKDAEGHYILEGGHRFDALRELGIDSFPALMVHDLESLAVPAVTKAEGGSISADDLTIEERPL